MTTVISKYIYKPSQKDIHTSLVVHYPTKTMHIQISTLRDENSQRTGTVVGRMGR